MLRRFPVTRLSLEALLLQEMRAVAAAAGARWDVVLQADAAPPDSRDWRNLQILVRRAMPAVEQALFAADRPVLLVYPDSWRATTRSPCWRSCAMPARSSATPPASLSSCHLMSNAPCPCSTANPCR